MFACSLELHRTLKIIERILREVVNRERLCGTNADKEKRTKTDRPALRDDPLYTISLTVTFKDMTWLHLLGLTPQGLSPKNPHRSSQVNPIQGLPNIPPVNRGKQDIKQTIKPDYRL